MCRNDCLDKTGIQIECPICDGVGCHECCDGKFAIACPRQFCSDMVIAINIATGCKNGVLPVAGGLLDQSNWFFELWQTLESEHSKIEKEKYRD